MLTLGIDEVGRGAWAGPLAVGAVVLDSKNVPDGLADSKKLTKKQREKLSFSIKQSAAAIGIGWVDAATIDRIGLSSSLKLAAERAVAQISPEIRAKLYQVIIDGTINFLARSHLIENDKVTTLPKADAKIAAVSAAAIVAKVFRDDYMTQLSQIFPDHAFDRHVGYGTALHHDKLRQFGTITSIHRQSFAPIAALDKSPTAETEPAKKVEQTMGRIAENIATTHLKTLGHRIIAQNWKTKMCEIDIVSEYRKTLYFTEVKYRANARHGDGLSAITSRKLKQMRFAAELFLAQHNEFANYDVKVAAISLSQNPPQIDAFIENII